MSEDFLQVYEDHLERVYAYFVYRLRSRADAEDLTQLTFERALQAWDRFDPERGAAATWLIAIARNALIDHRRRARSRPQSSLSAAEAGEADPPTAPSPEANLGLSPELAAALERLSRRERGLIALRFGADLRGPEIAELVGMSVPNVHQVLSRALRKLRRILEPEQGVATPAGAEGPKGAERD